MSDRISCPECGFPNKPDAMFCELCEAPLNARAKQILEKKKKLQTNPFKQIPGLPVIGNRIDFKEIISKNNRKTFLLILFFIIFFTAFGAAIGYINGNIKIGVIFTSSIAVIWVLISIFLGDEITLSLSGAKEITHNDEPQLFNIVEEMSIAAGVPMPKVYVIETDTLNAFAVGYSPKKASITVTRGLLKTLNREELQGVIGHEMSHIRFYDTRLMSLVSILVGIIVLFADLTLRSTFGFRRGGRRVRYGRSSGSSTETGNWIILVLVIVFIVISPVIATLIQMAISRKREFIADAGAVELTRNPTGLRSALEKMMDGNPYLETSSKATQHLFIVNPIKKISDKSSLFDTHPPLRRRIYLLKRMEA